MLERLHAHRAWANARLVDWYLALPAPEDYCLKMLSHVLGSERAWLQRLDKGSADADTWTLLKPEDLEARRSANEAEWPSVLTSDLNRICRYRRVDGQETQSTVADILTHVCTHGMYHRGQVAAQAARVGLKCPPTDFIVFSRLG